MCYGVKKKKNQPRVIPQMTVCRPCGQYLTHLSDGLVAICPHWPLLYQGLGLVIKIRTASEGPVSGYDPNL